MRNALLNVALVLMSMLAVLTAGEAGLRLAGRRPLLGMLRPSSVPGLVFENKRGVRTPARFIEARRVRDGKIAYSTLDGFYAVNELGLRDRRFSESDLRGRNVVLGLGDSTTYGIGVPFEAAWPKALERRLSGSGTVVVNAGVWGYDLWQYRAALEHWAPRLHPKAVVVAVFMNDHVRTPPLEGRRFQWEERLALAGEWRALEQAVKDRRNTASAEEYARGLAALVDPRSARALVSHMEATGETPERLLPQMRALLDLQAWGRALENVTAMKAYCDARGIRFVVAVLPVRAQLEFGYDHPQPQRAIDDFLRAAGVRFADLREPFRLALARGEPVYNNPSDGGHFGLVGHELVAAALVPLLR